ncbi:F0F1 ATP synthase subunit delta [Salisediminibacterium halotolerans]|uniref:F0F1 ATP synthase subunit delta n=1 Tax=Salisediminibacterium halotolerans TaxID=517425 RepID=UPI000EAF0ADD|nr:F0F1 ATP synthase subunit delta [Salisediminibacterium halotolerans]RLJ75798.1 ATP synthase F1 subcomplex delta subunit [Actinophytocola xinjiangensis]RPE89652.1 ATP synthase F1 subcomplex delta subunit [Salisediminibacterium halotolerans]TWG36411.1 ATP synthase F1 subcomplex delta subunit [Salisediminibacterium halotolerans]GEL08982.1 ATP synthase subunit delta [Salisediminibacterium halotolerans]
MRRHPVGYRYAHALFEIAQREGQLGQFSNELQLVAEAAGKTEKMKKVFHHPKMTADDKKKVFREAFEDSVHPQVLNLLFLLVDNKREDIITEVSDNYRQLANEAQGVAEAVVFSAKPLSESEKTAVAEAFAKRAGKAELMIENVVDEGIIGGIKVHIGDTVFDASVANQLNRIQQRMIQGT